MTERVIVRPWKGAEFPATVIDRRITPVGPEVLIEYLSVLGVNVTWLGEHQVRPLHNRCTSTNAEAR